MKRIFLAAASVAVLFASLLGGCGADGGDAKDSGVLYGEVREISEGKITVEVETIEKPEDTKEVSGEIVSSLKKTGEKKEITVAKGATVARENKSSISLSDISKGDIVSAVFDDSGEAGKITVLSGEGMGRYDSPDSYDSVKEYGRDTEKSGVTVKSDGAEENAVHIMNGAVASLSDFTVSRETRDSRDAENLTNFYGNGAAVLVTDGILDMKGGTVSTDAAGAAGVFAYGGGEAYISGTETSTQKGSSSGIRGAEGGVLYGWDLTAATKGEDSAAVRNDEGGGLLVLDGGTYTSDGAGSPAIYGESDIAANSAKFTANNAAAANVAGANSLRLYNCELAGNMPIDMKNDCTWNVGIYYGASDNSGGGNGVFEMDGGSLTAQNGGMFYTTNTESTFVLSKVSLTYAKVNEFFLRCTGNKGRKGWGEPGENGANCHFTAVGQSMEGDIIWDSISTLDMDITENSSLTGAVINDETCAGEGGDGYCSLYLGEGCTWTVTGDSTLTVLESSGTIVDRLGKTVTIKGKDGTVYEKGDSGYIVTVEAYQDSADVSGATEITQWTDYEVERP